MEKTEKREVKGYCPLGCGPTLALDASNQVYCTSPSCDRPMAAAEVLADHEIDHIVKLTQHDFTIRHPLRERLDDDLMRCVLHETLAAQEGPPGSPGVYRYVQRPDGVAWSAVRVED